MKFGAFTVLVALSGVALAKLPPPSEADKALTLQNIARQTRTAKQDAFESCRAQDRIVRQYQEGLRSKGKAIPTSIETGSCAEPGPYAADSGMPITSRPTEASGAHSPPATAVTPPSSTIPQSELPLKK